MRFTSTASAFLIGVSASHALGGESIQGNGIFTSQTRSITGSAFANDGLRPISDFDAEQAMDFGPFNAGVSASADIADVALGTGGGTQDSTLTLTGCIASGSAFATAESFDGKGAADGSGFSRFVLEFAIPSTSTFTLQGNIAAFDSGLTFVSLRDATTEVFGVTVVGTATKLPIDESGTLPPGGYTLEIESSGSAFADPFTSEFAFAEYGLDFDVAAIQAVPTISQWGAIVLAGFILGAGTLILRRRHVVGGKLLAG